MRPYRRTYEEIKVFFKLAEIYRAHISTLFCVTIRMLVCTSLTYTTLLTPLLYDEFLLWLF